MMNLLIFLKSEGCITGSSQFYHDILLDSVDQGIHQVSPRSSPHCLCITLGALCGFGSCRKPKESFTRQKLYEPSVVTVGDTMFLAVCHKMLGTWAFSPVDSIRQNFLHCIDRIDWFFLGVDVFAGKGVAYLMALLTFCSTGLSRWADFWSCCSQNFEKLCGTGRDQSIGQKSNVSGGVKLWFRPNHNKPNPKESKSFG